MFSTFKSFKLLVLLIQTTSPQILLWLLPALFLSLAELSSARSPAPQYSWGSVFQYRANVDLWMQHHTLVSMVLCSRAGADLEPRTPDVVDLETCTQNRPACSVTTTDLNLSSVSVTCTLSRALPLGVPGGQYVDAFTRCSPMFGSDDGILCQCFHAL
ncbi:hypothetical protein B0H13DRAFT_1852283 [Mycena leptocephala]|nr:hypothetical protein B0H13DRAFT_1852283 [Mycena leptocephala]